MNLSEVFVAEHLVKYIMCVCVGLGGATVSCFIKKHNKSHHQAFPFPTAEKQEAEEQQIVF